MADGDPPPLRLLLIDAAPGCVDQVGRLLAETGLKFALDTLTDRQAALSALAEDRHDLCLMAGHFRQQGGMDLLKAALHAGSTVPIVLLVDEEHSCCGDADGCVLECEAQDALFLDTLTASALRRCIRQVTTRDRLQRQLRASQAELRRHGAELERLKTTLDAHAIVSVADVYGNITYVNDLFCEVSGYAREELVGRNHRLLKSGRHDAAFYEEMWGRLANGQTWQGEVCNRRKDGSCYWVRGTIVPFAGEDGLPYQYVSVRTDITAIKQAEEELRLFGQALEASVDGIAIADARQPDMPLIYVNLAFQQMTGYAREAFIGRNCRFLQGAETDQLGLAEVRAALAEGRPGRALLRNYRKDGRPYWNDFSIAPVRDGQGQVSHFIGVANDVTARHEAETALQQSEERLRRSQAYANIGTWDWNIKTGELYWSERIGPLFGYDSLVETSYENFLAAVHPDDRQKVIDAVNACVERGERYQVEHRVVWPDGSVRWMLEQGDVTRDPDGSPAHMLGVVQDITERKLAQERLEASQTSLANAQRIAHLGSWQFDFASGALTWSDEIYRIFGHQPGDFAPSAESFYAAVHPDDLELVKASEARACSTGIHDVVHRIVRPDGSIRHVHEVAEMVTDGQGLPLRLTGTVRDVTEQVASERAIRASEARLANAQRIAHLGNWDYDLISGRIGWSEEVYRIFGFEPGSISPDIQHYYDWTHPEDLALLREAEERTAREGKGEIVHRIVRQDGSIRYVRLIGELELDTMGRPLRMTGTLQDITAEREAEEVIRQRERDLSMAQRVAHIGSYNWNPVTEELNWSDEHFRLWGLKPGEAVPSYQLFKERLHPDDLPRVEAMLQQALQGEVVYDCTHRVRWPDGTERHIHGQGEVMFDEAGQAVRMIGTVQDISEHKRNEHALEQLAARNRALMESAYDGILLADLEGHLLDANRRAEEITGYRRDQMLQMHASQLHPASARAQVAASFQNILNQGHVLEHIDVERPDGSIVPVDISASLIDQDGERYILGIFRDVSERAEREAALRLAKEEAERANQAKSLFLSSMSHELRTPMNAILGFSQLLQMHPELTADQNENVEEILRAGRHLLALINEVLDLAKIEAGRIDLSLEPVSCCELVQECLTLVRPLAERLGIRLQQDLQLACPVWIRADRTRLKQVIVNLLSNAIKYNRPEGSVTLRLLPAAGGGLHIAVEDTGLGIRPEQQAELFQPFHRLHDADSGIEGTGIGLSITKRLVEAMQGRIGLDSTYGVGSTFWVELPLSASSDQADYGFPAEAGPGRDDPAANVTLLYVEDNPANLRLVERVVQGQGGWRLFTAHEPVLGLELARAHASELDVILLDINLPGLDGYEVLEQLRADAVTASIPVVALSANAMPADIRRGEAAGFAAYLTKPLNLGQFHATLNQLLAGRSQVEDSPSP